MALGKGIEEIERSVAESEDWLGVKLEESDEERRARADQAVQSLENLKGLMLTIFKDADGPQSLAIRTIDLVKADVVKAITGRSES